MYFLGREKETKKIIKSLRKGNNIIISGKFGIGRTSLIRHIEDITRNEWHFAFADFSLMPGEICRQLLSQLTSRKKRSQQGQLSSKSSLFQLDRLEPSNRGRILVLDNIASLTPKKMYFLRYISETKKFQFVAIIESFIPKEALLRLRVALMPSELMRLSYIDKHSARGLLEYFSEKYGLGWTAPKIQSLVSITRGYPLSLKELAMKHAKESISNRND